MAGKICFQCFKRKDDRDVCPYCGYKEHAGRMQAYQLPPGAVLRKRYVIGVSLGIGGFGITYKAFDVTLGLIVAIKEFYPAGLVNRAGGQRRVGVFSGEKKLEFERQLQRFLEEARSMALFSKEQDIVNVYDYFEENQTAYIIMEYVDAPLLKDVLKKRRFGVEEATGYMLAVLDALEKVHRHSIIHKDVSPDNLFLTGENTVKLFDFGAARLQGMERTEAVVVKAGYTPPEQYTSTDHLDETADIYAAGAVFYEMITGEKPVDARDRVITDELKKLEDFSIDADEYLERIIFKAMALEPRLRFQNTGQFKDALISRKKVRIPQEEIKRNRRRKRILAAVLAAVILITGSIVGLNMTVFSGRGRIDIAQIKEEELTIWLPSEADVSGGELVDRLLESAAKVCPQIRVNAQVVPSEDYEDRLMLAMEQECLPDVFCIDFMQQLQGGETAADSDWKAHCAELSSLLRTMNLSEYLYLDSLQKEGEVYFLPTAVQIGVVYINEEKTSDVPENVQLDQLKVQESCLGYADEGDAFTKFQDPDEPVSWIVGDLSAMDQVEAVTVEAVPSTDFGVAALLQDEKLLGNLKNCYAVKKSGDKNRQDAGMVLLSLLFSEGMQSVSYMDNEEGLPLNRAVLEIYKENKLTTYLNFLREYDLEEIQIYEGGSISGRVREELDHGTA